MNNNLYRNNSGCSDPTSGQALSNIMHDLKVKQSEVDAKLKEMRNRQLVYICSKYAGDTVANTALALKYCKFAIRRNVIPLASHILYPQMLDDENPAEREMGLQFGLALLSKCSEVWVFTEDHKLSDGMKGEIAYAKRLGKTVKYFGAKKEAKI